MAGVGGTLTVGIDQAPTGCNPNTASGDTWADRLVLAPVLPSAFEVGHGHVPSYDSAVINQAEVVNTTPADRRLHNQPQGGVVRRGAHHRRRLRLRLARAAWPVRPGHRHVQHRRRQHPGLPRHRVGQAAATTAGR